MVHTRRSSWRRAAATLVLCLFSAGPVAAATYYVDPVSGSNGNAGTSPGAPWKTPPGTRTANNGGFVSNTWGAISTSNKVACGDRILLKGGTTQTSAHGGAWRIDPTYYSTCSAGQRITLRVATSAEWSGSTGPFTIDASGITPTFDPTYGFSSHAGIISVSNRNFIEVRGAGIQQRLRVLKASALSMVVSCNHNCPGGWGEGFRGDWLEFAQGTGGFNIGRYRNWQVSNSIGHHMRNGPWQTGMNNDQLVENGGFVNVQGYDSGCGSVAAPGCTQGNGQEDLFFFVGGRSLWCVNCQAYRGGERGVNTGVIQDRNMGGDFVYRFRNLRAWDNGATCVGSGPHFCAAAGIYVSGNDWVDGNTARTHVVGATLVRNADMGAGAYGGGAIEVWHATTYNTNWRRQDTGSYVFDRTAKWVKLFNGVDLRINGAKPFGWNNANGQLPQKQYTPVALNNCLRPISADSEPLGVNDGTGWPGSGTYASPPAFLPASTNRIGLSKCDPRFASLNPAAFDGNDFTPQAGSSAIDAGRFLMRAAGGGSNATTITVKANGSSSDPRDYFIAPNSFLDAEADTIQIEGCGRVRITGMTANSISFTPACSWADNAGVHLPWAGSAPDAGAIEAGVLAVPPAAPALLSAQLLAP